ncbi:MAG: hypothetical protein WB930_08460 [Syntrophobacteraceae bacterium]
MKHGMPFWTRTAVLRSLSIGILYCPVGLGLGAFAAYQAIGEGYRFFPLYAGVAALITCSVLWWLIIERPCRRGVAAGIVAGALAGLLSHPVCWYLKILAANIGYWVLRTGAYSSSLGEPPVDPLNGLWGAFVLSLWSWLFFGWVTIPSGGIIGGLFARLLKRRRRTSVSGS